jgi:hypothetical protein
MFASWWAEVTKVPGPRKGDADNIPPLFVVVNPGKAKTPVRTCGVSLAFLSKLAKSIEVITVVMFCAPSACKHVQLTHMHTQVTRKTNTQELGLQDTAQTTQNIVARLLSPADVLLAWGTSSILGIHRARCLN